MSPCADALGDSRNRKVHCRQPKIDDVAGITVVSEPFQTPRQRVARQSGFKSETPPLRLEVVKPRQHDPAGFNSRVLRAERG